MFVIHGDTLVEKFKLHDAKIPILAICGPGQNPCPTADYELESFDPRNLLELLGSLVPKKAAGIEEHEEQLNREV